MRKRSKENADCPDNVYPKRIKGIVYYYFEHPQTHKAKSLGSDKEQAFIMAHALNTALWSKGIIERTPKVVGVTCKQLADEYYAWKKDQIKKDSAKNLKYQLDRFVREFGFKQVEAVTTRDLYLWLGQFTQGVYRRNKIILNGMFEFGINVGLKLDKNNPAAQVLHAKKTKRQRMRLEKPEFDAIYKKASPALQLTMLIMLNTSLRPSDVLNLKFKQFDNGCLRVLTSKTQVVIEYHFTKETEKQIIRRARQTGIASPFIVHEMPQRMRKNKAKAHHTQLTLDRISREFKEIRNTLAVYADIAPKLRPPLYEIRSLAARLSKDKNAAQSILGHLDEGTTDIYLEGNANDYRVIQAEVTNIVIK